MFNFVACNDIAISWFAFPQPSLCILPDDFPVSGFLSQGVDVVRIFPVRPLADDVSGFRLAQSGV